MASESPAIAVTDTNNLFGALEFANKASKEGIQPIIGCQLDICFDDTAPEAAARTHRQTGPECQPLTLIAATEQGYANLVRIVSDAYLATEPGLPPHRPVSALRGHCDGIICLTGGPLGPLGVALADDHAELAETRLLKLRDLFGDRLYVEVERVGDYDRAIEQKTIDLAYRHELPLVATNEAFFRARDDFDAHDALIAIAEGSVIAVDDRRRLTPDNYLKSAAEMAALFADLPEAIENTVEIARRCSYYPQKRKPILPYFTTGAAQGSDPTQAEAAELRKQARDGFDGAHRYTRPDRGLYPRTI